MSETSALGPRDIVRRFSSHEKQEEEDLKYWAAQPLSVKVDAVAELAKYFAEMNHVDLDAQGPKRLLTRSQRA